MAPQQGGRDMTKSNGPVEPSVPNADTRAALAQAEAMSNERKRRRDHETEIDRLQLDPLDLARLAALERLNDAESIAWVLSLMFPSPSGPADWIRAPNTALGGRTGLDYMLSDDPFEIAWLRAYVLAEARS